MVYYLLISDVFVLISLRTTIAKWALEWVWNKGMVFAFELIRVFIFIFLPKTNYCYLCTLLKHLGDVVWHLSFVLNYLATFCIGCKFCMLLNFFPIHTVLIIFGRYSTRLYCAKGLGASYTVSTLFIFNLLKLIHTESFRGLKSPLCRF